jgi:hypothetical protein
MMMIRATLFAGAIAAATSYAAQAAESCLPDFTSLDVFQDASAPTFSHRLKSRNVKGPFLTRATLDGKSDDGTLNLTFRFKTDGVSLAYNIYAILVAAGPNLLLWRDLTNGCKGPGISIFPGQQHALPAIKLSGSGKSNLHIIVWGRL